MIGVERLRYPKKWADLTLTDDLCLEQWIVPKGTVVRTQETKNFGWIHLPDGCRDKRGFAISRRLFKW